MDPTLEGKQSLRSPSEQRGEVKVSELTAPTNWIPSQPLMQQRRGKMGSQTLTS